MSILRSLAKNDYSKVTSLLKKGFSPNERDKLGRTPLLIAVDAGNFNLATELLRFKADPEIPDFAGRTATSAAPDFFREKIEKHKEGLQRAEKFKFPEDADICEPELVWTGGGWKPKNREFPFFVQVNKHRSYRSTGTTILVNPLCPRGA